MSELIKSFKKISRVFDNDTDSHIFNIQGVLISVLSANSIYFYSTDKIINYNIISISHIFSLIFFVYYIYVMPIHFVRLHVELNAKIVRHLRIEGVSRKEISYVFMFIYVFNIVKIFIASVILYSVFTAFGENATIMFKYEISRSFLQDVLTMLTISILFLLSMALELKRAIHKIENRPD